VVGKDHELVVMLLTREVDKREICKTWTTDVDVNDILRKRRHISVSLHHILQLCWTFLKEVFEAMEA
jgi:hypothetical protein